MTVKQEARLNRLLAKAKRVTKSVAAKFRDSEPLCYIKDGHVIAAVGIYAKGKPIPAQRDGELLKACADAGAADCKCIRGPGGDLVCYWTERTIQAD